MHRHSHQGSRWCAETGKNQHVIRGACQSVYEHFNKRFARLGLEYSRKLSNHRYAIALFAAAYNFCKVHNTLGCTPAVGLKLATETWTIEKLIEAALATN